MQCRDFLKKGFGPSFRYTKTKERQKPHDFQFGNLKPKSQFTKELFDSGLSNAGSISAISRICTTCDLIAIDESALSKRLSGKINLLQPRGNWIAAKCLILVLEQEIMV